MRRFLRALLCVVPMSLMLAACGGGGSPSGGSVSTPPTSPPQSVSSLQIIATPQALTVTAGSSAAFTLTATPATAVPLTVTLANAPSGVTLASGSSDSSTGVQNETISVAATVAQGTYALSLNAGSGSVMASTGLTLTVNAAPTSGSLQISAAPSALTVPAGGSQGFTLNVSPASALPVTLSLAGSVPAGISLVAGNSDETSGTQAATLNVAATTATGTYTLSVQASSGTQTATTPLTVLVNPQLPAALTQIEQQTFDYFWNTTNPNTGLAPDHYNSATGDVSPYASIAATGFALSAYPIGVQNGWVTRTQAAQGVLTPLQFLAGLTQGTASSGDAGYNGFFYHFLDVDTGLRYGTTTGLSSVDNALLMAGVLFDASYFNQDNSTEQQIRLLANQLYDRVNWQWMTSADPPLVNLDWTPENGFSPYNWQGYNEAMILIIEAMGSPTYPIASNAWQEWAATYPQFWGTYYGRQQLSFGPLFGSQYSEAWVDFRGIQDAFMKSEGIDYFINSRRATESQQSYAIANPDGWTGYGADLWGLTACDGPGQFSFTTGSGKTVSFQGYYARGAGLQDAYDDGTIAPTAALSSIVFAPQIVIPTMQAILANYGAYIHGQYGFFDAFNPSFTYTTVTPASGAVTAIGWVDSRYLGIDQGPILMMLQNYQDGLVWKYMRRSPPIVAGLQRAGFTGGWLAGTPAVQ